MNLKKSTIEGLQNIIKKDYKVSIKDAEANQMSLSLLRLSKLVLLTLARMSETESNKKISK